VLCALAAHAAIAIEAAQQTARTKRHRTSLEQLLEVSSTPRRSVRPPSISRRSAVASTRAWVQRVSIELVDIETGLLRSAAFSGGAGRSRRAARRSVRSDARAVDPEFEVSGCYLVPNDEASGAHRRGSHQVQLSAKRPRPQAWDHHWLLVPLPIATARRWVSSGPMTRRTGLCRPRTAAGAARLREPGDDRAVCGRAVRADALPRRPRIRSRIC